MTVKHQTGSQQIPRYKCLRDTMNKEQIIRNKFSYVQYSSSVSPIKRMLYTVCMALYIYFKLNQLVICLTNVTYLTAKRVKMEKCLYTYISALLQKHI